MFMPWVWMFRHKQPKKPVPHFPTLRELEGVSGWIKANNEALQFQQRLIETFTPEQNKLYGELREKSGKALMLKPDLTDTQKEEI
jgi:hypothetical protein